MSHDDLTGRLWSQASEELQRGFEGQALQVQVLDITPPEPARSPQQAFAWGGERVVRVRVEGEQTIVTVAREMRIEAGAG